MPAEKEPQMSVAAEPFMSTREVAEYLNVPKSTLDYWSYHSQGPRFTRVGSKRRYRRQDVDEWLAQQPTGGGPATDRTRHQSGKR
jgi:excisionase family DNA binding protein